MKYTPTILAASIGVAFLSCKMPKDPCLNNDGCDVNATCKAEGSYITKKVWAVCTCKPGYSGDGKAGHCSAIDSCTINNGGCDTNAICTSTGPGTNTCACKTGYEGNGQAGHCFSINSCNINNGGCDVNATCTSTGPGTNTCACNTGYTGNGQAGQCAIVDSCLTNNGGCDVNAVCTSTGPGTNACTCAPGYAGSGQAGQCAPINNCLTLNGGCDINATCTSTGPGTNVCACNSGYSGSGQAGQCFAIDSCLTNNGGCDTNATCTSTGPGTNTCSCNAGYSGNGQIGQCSAIDNCLTNNGGCDVNATCTSTGPGLNICSCNAGYSGNGQAGQCVPINNCTTNNGGCDINATCTNTGPGTNTCACNTGYTGNGQSGQCVAINNCTTNNGGCDFHALCTNTGPGTNTCACNTGYTGDGHSCCSKDDANWLLPLTDCPTYTTTDGVATDPRTRLKWQRAMNPNAQLNFQTARTYCANLNLEGLTWRLPTRMELFSTVSWCSSYPGPMVDTNIFPNTVSQMFYTSTEFVNFPNEVAVVDFRNGTIGRISSTLNVNKYVRCVSDIDVVPVCGYTIKTDTVYDKGTDLIWQRGNSSTRLLPAAAATYCGGLNLGALSSGWRVPTAVELASLDDVKQYNPSIDPLAFPNTLSAYYGTTTNYNADGNAGLESPAVDFMYGGFVGYGGQSDPQYIRCVHDAVSSCTDGINNGIETDVDCGGEQCPVCADGLSCLDSQDCASNVCINNLCVPGSG